MLKSFKSLLVVASLMGLFLISLADYAKAGSTGAVTFNNENGNCTADWMNFNSVTDVEGEGTGRVKIKPNGDVSATCDFKVSGDKIPEAREVNTNFDCNILINGQENWASSKKATLKTNGKVDIECKAKIDTQTNDTNSDRKGPPNHTH